MSTFARSGSARLALVLIIAAVSNACAPAIDPRLVADAQTAARVKTALVNDAKIGTRPIEVRVSRGVVRLSGDVESAAEIERAVTLARSVSGVVKVDSELKIRPPARVGSPAPSAIDSSREWGLERSRRRDWLAVGLSVNRHHTADEGLASAWTIYPLIRVGARAGFGPAIGFGWFTAGLNAQATNAAVGRVRIKPVMAGVGYTMRRARISASASIVGGYAFNRFTLNEVPIGEPVPVSVDNSIAFRPGLSVWYDLSNRITVNVSAGYVITRPRLDVVRDGRLETRPLRADTTVIGVGLAWKLF